MCDKECLPIRDLFLPFFLFETFRHLLQFVYLAISIPIPVAVRSEAYFCSRSIVGIAVSNPLDGLDVRVFSLLCVVWVLCVGLITRIEECYRVCVSAI